MSPDQPLYNRQFFVVFGGVVLFMSGVALQFHFGQYVQFLGYGVDDLGRVLGISMLGTIAIRLHIGLWIDRFGCRRIWLAGSAVVALCVVLVQFVDSLWWIVVLRATLSQMAIAAVMTTVAVFAALVAPPQRRAESIGVIGLAGFLGMIVGPTVGDWIFSGDTASFLPYRVFFSAAAAFSGMAGLLMLGLGGAGLGPPPAAARPSIREQWGILRGHWPGSVLIVGVVFGMAFALPGQFLERLAEARGFKDIKWFFLVYAPTAITLRVLFRQAPQVLGRVPTVLGGLLLLAAGQLCLIGAERQWDLILPGLLIGAGHCFVFPSMVDLGADALPPAYRGTGTALILGSGDVGTLIGFLLFGELIETCGFPVMLCTLATSVLTGALILAVCARGRWR